MEYYGELLKWHSDGVEKVEEIFKKEQQNAANKEHLDKWKAYNLNKIDDLFNKKEEEVWQNFVSENAKREGLFEISNVEHKPKRQKQTEKKATKETKKSTKKVKKCYHCSEKDHLKANCPKREKKVAEENKSAPMRV